MAVMHVERCGTLLMECQISQDYNVPALITLHCDYNMREWFQKEIYCTVPVLCIVQAVVEHGIVKILGFLKKK
jgi:hypothetical protein